MDHIVDQRLVQLAVTEDMPDGDRSMHFIKNVDVTAHIVCREPDIMLCGTTYVDAVARSVSQHLNLAEGSVEWHCSDGQILTQGQIICTLQGGAHWLFATERPALNFLMRLSGLASHCHKIRSTTDERTVLLDTRKTTPGWRLAEKYAFATGGFVNHRRSLSQAAMLKDSHRPFWHENATTGRGPLDALEVEVDTIAQIPEALALNPNVVMLDNFAPDQLAEAAALIPAHVHIEYSGNADPAHIPETLRARIRFVSMGRALQECAWADFGLDLLPQE